MIPAFFRNQLRGLRRRVFPITLEISVNPPREDSRVMRFEGVIPGDRIAMTEVSDGHEWMTIKVR